MFFGTPKRSITSSAFGSAASELAVVNAIRNGSRIALTKVQNGTRIRYDTPPTTISTKIARPRYISAISLPSVRQDAEPLAADRRGNRGEHADRRERHHVAGELEHRVRRALEHVEHRLALRADAPRAATPKNVENTTTCRMSPRAIASTTDVGNRCRKMSQACCWFCAIAAAAVVSRAERHRQAGAGLERC